jgi:hypothetical protein
MGYYQYFPALQGLCMKTEATVVSSSLPVHLTMPAFLKSASTAESDETIAPVCDIAALMPGSVLPAFIAAILHPLFISDDA